MASIDDFRFESHQLLLELDAATMGMMQLVSSKCVSGPNWDAAIKRQHDAYERWDTFIGVPAVAALEEWSSLLRHFPDIHIADVSHKGRL